MCFNETFSGILILESFMQCQGVLKMINKGKNSKKLFQSQDYEKT